jgi:tetratricopeptide (TPR) repeat protein
MRRTLFGAIFRSLGGLIFVPVTLVALSLVVATGITRADGPGIQAAAPAKAVAQAAQLVQKALIAEANGLPDDRASFLKQALAMAPDYAPAHWQSGEIRSGDTWSSIDDAAKHDAHSAKLDEYRKLRDQAGATVDDQLNLARWCEKAGLKEQQRAHLMFALQLQPNNKEAINKLGLVRYRGRLVPAKQLDDIKAQMKQSLAESKEWKTRVDGWRARLQEHPGDQAVLKQIRAVRDPAAIHVMERGLAHSGQEACLAVINALATMPQQSATDALLWAALFSSYEKVSDEATYELKSRSPYDYVPLLLSAMKMPIHVEYDVMESDTNNFSHQLDLFRAGQGQDEEYILNQQTELSPLVVGNGRPTPQGVAASSQSALNAMQSTAQSQQRRVSSMVEQVGHINAQSAELNTVLAQVLQSTTGNNFGDNPESWWNWWYDQNDYYQPPENPVNVSSDSSTTIIPRTRVSCFPAGTPVWTTSGPMLIEQIKIGELVLAQDSETGELAYKPVLGTTIRPASPLVETHIGETQIRSTRGHPFWVDGKGWQMAKELKAGEWLHTVHGPVQIDSAEPSDEAVCYNLIVADFHDYFVSAAKVLVHDNLLRGPTLATVPGLAEGN